MTLNPLDCITLALSQIEVKRIELGITHRQIARHLGIGLNAYYRHRSRRYYSFSVDQIVLIYELFSISTIQQNNRISNHYRNTLESKVCSTN